MYIDPKIIKGPERPSILSYLEEGTVIYSHYESGQAADGNWIIMPIAEVSNPIQYFTAS